MIPKTKKIWMDGEFVDWEEAKIHVLTHTLHYGLGVFEGIRCYLCHNGRSAVFRLKDHVDRLFEGTAIAQITIPFDKEEITEAILETLRVNELIEAYIRPLIFVGEGEMGLYIENYPVRVIIAVWPWGAYLGEEGLRNGIRAKISSLTRYHVNAIMTKAKICGNYVNSIMAKKEVKQAGYDEAILLDSEGYVAEASGENIFLAKNGVLKTTPLTSILAGITRDSVISIAKEKGIKVLEERFTRDELYVADEAFFTGTAAEITPIREVDSRIIGDGKPGSLTRAIQETFFAIVHGREGKYKDWLVYI